MKKSSILFLLAGMVLSSLVSCTDHCEATRTYRTAVGTTWSAESIRAGVKALPPQSLERPAKLYIKDDYLFISEAKRGIHIIDNSNPANPVAVAFLDIPGAVDMAVKNNTLYVDSFMDVVALDITDPTKVREIGRRQNTFQNGLYEGLGWYYDATTRLVYDNNWKTVSETVKTNCGANQTYWPVYYRGGLEDGFALSSSSGKGSSGGTGNTNGGTGGSMARFLVYDDYLYTLTQDRMLLFDIQNEAKPDSIAYIYIGNNIETIFPYEDKLFIGSNNGMYIYDNSDPKAPRRLSVFQHARACDPVVVQNDIAYITLRESWCGASPNQLDVVNISDLSRPTLIKSYDMQNPHGLGIDGDKLFICEGRFGLKSFNAASAQDITLRQHIKDINAFDVIPLADNRLLMVGSDGFYQFDTSDPNNLRQLSKIPVVEK